MTTSLERATTALRCACAGSIGRGAPGTAAGRLSSGGRAISRGARAFLRLGGISTVPLADAAASSASAVDCEVLVAEPMATSTLTSEAPTWYGAPITSRRRRTTPAASSHPRSVHTSRSSFSASSPSRSVSRRTRSARVVTCTRRSCAAGSEPSPTGATTLTLMLMTVRGWSAGARASARSTNRPAARPSRSPVTGRRPVSCPRRCSRSLRAVTFSWNSTMPLPWCTGADDACNRNQRSSIGDGHGYSSSNDARSPRRMLRSPEATAPADLTPEL